MVKNKLTGAHYGLLQWLKQRITACIMLVLSTAVLAFVTYAHFNVDVTIGSWQALFSHTGTKLLAQIFFVAVIMHAWVGIRDVIMDYLQCNSLKLFIYTLIILWLFASLIYSIKILWI